MLRIVTLILILVLFDRQKAICQDKQPDKVVANKTLAKLNPPEFSKRIFDTISIDKTIPVPTFINNSNELKNNIEVLYPFFEKMRKSMYEITSDSVKIVHLGDSHVRGNIFPQTTARLLRKDFHMISYTNIGINGATTTNFTSDKLIRSIEQISPDLLILSFGTNESHNLKYNNVIHYNQIHNLVETLRKFFPKTPIILTTPPGSYESFKRRRNLLLYANNPRTSIAAQTIKKYTENNNLLLWDLYSIAGGKKASDNWFRANLMRPDRIHYQPEGYVLHGSLLYQAIIKAYNSYVNI